MKVIGYEGIASRNYFEAMSGLVNEEFAFEKRTKRYAADPFNTMLNIGYSLLTKEIRGELENRGLNPYFGFVHKDKPGHPALASDLIEEWRTVLVDSAVMSLVQGNEISLDEFEWNEDKCVLSEEGLRIVLRKFENKMNQKNSYLKYIDKPLSFLEAIWHQVERLGRAIDETSTDRYEPIRIR